MFLSQALEYNDPTEYLSQHSSLDGFDSSDDLSGNRLLPILLLIRSVMLNPLIYIDEGISPNRSTDARTSQSSSSALEPPSEIGQPRTSAGIHQILALHKTVLFVYLRFLKIYLR